MNVIPRHWEKFSIEYAKISIFRSLEDKIWKVEGTRLPLFKVEIFAMDVIPRYWEESSIE